MKIKEAQGVELGHAAAVAGVSASLPSDAPNPVGAVTAIDSITTEESDHLRSSVAAGVNLVGTERATRLASLTQAVRSGNYHPNVSQLAGQLLAMAQLDAHLASLMG